MVLIWNLVSSSKLIQVVGTMQFLKVVGLTDVLIFLLAVGRESLSAPEGCPSFRVTWPSYNRAASEPAGGAILYNVTPLWNDCTIILFMEHNLIKAATSLASASPHTQGEGFTQAVHSRGLGSGGPS